MKIADNVNELAAMPALGMFGKGLAIALGAWVSTLILFAFVAALSGLQTIAIAWHAGVVLATLAGVIGLFVLLGEAPGTCRKKAAGWALGNLLCGSVYAAVAMAL